MDSCRPSERASLRVGLVMSHLHLEAVESTMKDVSGSLGAWHASWVNLAFRVILPLPRITGLEIPAILSRGGTLCRGCGQACLAPGPTPPDRLEQVRVARIYALMSEMSDNLWESWMLPSIFLVASRWWQGLISSILPTSVVSSTSPPSLSPSSSSFPPLTAWRTAGKTAARTAGRTAQRTGWGDCSEDCWEDCWED